MWSEVDAFRVATCALLTAIVVFASIYCYLQRRSKGKEVLSVSKKQRSEKASQPSKARRLTDITHIDLRSSFTSDSTDAWEERRRRGIPAASLHEKKDAESDKPFGSSYYYAHNSAKTTGGYKDGLRMDDFTMNGPRLLSRGGKPVNEFEPSSAQSDSDALPPSTEPPLDRKASSDLKRTLPITRYLWDDPGDATGMATIRIDELPGKHSTQTVAWQDVNVSISNIAATLILKDEGLQVKIETNGDADYLLRIPKLYGQVTEVEAITKAKRLLVRLKKKKGLWDKSNLKAWPHPQKKTS